MMKNKTFAITEKLSNNQLSWCRMLIHEKMEPYKDLNSDSQRAKKTCFQASCCILSNTLPNLSIPNVPVQVLLSTLIRSRFQVKPATLLIPINLFLYFWWNIFTSYLSPGGMLCVN
jgi:hypothetical protein